jgi:hypothetical protein
MQSKPFDQKPAEDERILKIVGQNILVMNLIRQKGDFIGISVNVNENSIGVILDAPVPPYMWHQLCFSFDPAGFFRLNFNGETLLTQRIKTDVQMLFATKTTLTFGSDDKKVICITERSKKETEKFEKLIFHRFLYQEYMFRYNLNLWCI